MTIEIIKARFPHDVTAIFAAIYKFSGVGREDVEDCGGFDFSEKEMYDGEETNTDRIGELVAGSWPTKINIVKAVNSREIDELPEDWKGMIMVVHYTPYQSFSHRKFSERMRRKTAYFIVTAK